MTPLHSRERTTPGENSLRIFGSYDPPLRSASPILISARSVVLSKPPIASDCNCQTRSRPRILRERTGGASLAKRSLQALRKSETDNSASAEISESLKPDPARLADILLCRRLLAKHSVPQISLRCTLQPVPKSRKSGAILWRTLLHLSHLWTAALAPAFDLNRRFATTISRPSTCRPEPPCDHEHVRATVT